MHSNREFNENDESLCRVSKNCDRKDTSDFMASSLEESVELFSAEKISGFVPFRPEFDPTRMNPFYFGQNLDAVVEIQDT